MQLTVFAKEMLTKKGQFTRYIARLTNKNTGEQKTVSVKFRQTAGQPESEECPCIIEVAKQDANLVEKPYIDPETGEIAVNGDGSVKLSSTLWVSSWEMVGPYIDHSLDDYE